MWRLRKRCFFLIKNMSTIRTQCPISKSRTIFDARNGMNSRTIRRNAHVLKSGCIMDDVKITPIKVYLQSAIQSSNLSQDREILHIHFENAGQLSFPVIWLRDNCQCTDCYDSISASRIHDQQLLKHSLLPMRINCTSGEVCIIWEDGHTSHFSKEWLCNHSFEDEHQRERPDRRLMQRIKWNARDFNEKIDSRRFSFNDILVSDETLLEWLQQLAKYGVAFLSGSPLKSGELEKVADRVAFIRRTHYGEQFTVQGSADAENVAYKKGALQLHTDLPYYNFMPGIIMLQCVKPSSEGGENILSDGLNAASLLPEEMYKILSEIVVDWVDIGSHEDKRFHSINREPVLCLDPYGNLNKINWSQPQRDTIFNVSARKAVDWYKAALEFTKIIHHKDNAVQIKIKEGDVLTFDNRRTLHGRTDYVDSGRLLYGAYIDWDEIYSRIRILQNEAKCK